MHHQGLQYHWTLVNRIEATFIIWLDQESIGERFTSVVLFCVSMCVKEVKMQDAEVFHLQQNDQVNTTGSKHNYIPGFHLSSLKKNQASFLLPPPSGWTCGTSHPLIGICESEDFGVAFYTQHWDTRHEGHGETEGDVEGWWWNTHPTTPSPDINGVK